MPLVRMDILLAEARRQGYALGAFECWNSDNIHAIARAAAETGCPVIFQASPAEYELLGGPEVLRAIVETYVNKFGITAALHLDHGATIAHVEECLQAGFTSVMLDASTLPYEQNCALARRTVELAHPLGVSVEAELGHVGGAAEGGIACEQALTDPEEAERFVAESGVDCLAVAIGTVHGEYRGKPELRLGRLKEIAARIAVPLVLHGGSGTPPEQLSQAIALGIAKINICTEIDKTYIAAVKAAEMTPGLTPSVPGFFYRPAVAAVAAHVARLIRQFWPQPNAPTAP